MTAIGLLARAELRRGWRSLAMLALLVAVVCTVVVGALAGARRTSTAPTRMMEAQRYPDVTLQLERSTTKPSRPSAVYPRWRPQPCWFRSSAAVSPNRTGTR